MMTAAYFILGWMVLSLPIGIIIGTVIAHGQPEHDKTVPALPYSDPSQATIPGLFGASS